MRRFITALGITTALLACGGGMGGGRSISGLAADTPTHVEITVDTKALQVTTLIYAIGSPVPAPQKTEIRLETDAKIGPGPITSIAFGKGERCSRSGTELMI